MNINSEEFKTILNELNIQFVKFCTLTLLSDKTGSICIQPQKRYNNIKHYAYLDNVDDDTVFCKFKPDLPCVKGVYLWVVNDEIIYIGESVNIKSRFNDGYGNISPRNCYVGGQSTNVRMNKVALLYNRDKNPIDIYYCITDEHKKFEILLLNKINTKYNKKNNKKGVS